MADRRILSVRPVACTLDAAEGAAQVARWRTFDDDYLLSTEEQDGRYVAHYAKVDDSRERLTALVARESGCCAFVDWTIDATGHDLRLVVTGSPDALAALSIR